MARHKVSGGSVEAPEAVTAPKVPAEERTIPMFEDAWPPVLLCQFCKKTSRSADCIVVDKTARKCSSCGAALSRMNHAPVPTAADVIEGAAQDIAAALGKGFFGGNSAAHVDQATAKAEGAPPANGESVDAEPVTATRGAELYGKPGTFSTYTIGPFTMRTSPRAGETRAQAMGRLLEEMREVAAIEREKMHAEFVHHFMTKVVGK